MGLLEKALNYKNQKTDNDEDKDMDVQPGVESDVELNLDDLSSEVEEVEIEDSISQMEEISIDESEMDTSTLDDSEPIKDELTPLEDELDLSTPTTEDEEPLSLDDIVDEMEPVQLDNSLLKEIKPEDDSPDDENLVEVKSEERDNQLHEDSDISEDDSKEVEPEVVTLEDSQLNDLDDILDDVQLDDSDLEVIDDNSLTSELDDEDEEVLIEPPSEASLDISAEVESSVDLSDDSDDSLDENIPTSEDLSSEWEVDFVESSDDDMIEELDESDESDQENGQINFPSTSKADKKFQDFVVLYEISKEIMESDSLEDIYDFVLFSVMGQLGASSASIIVPSDNPEKWILTESRGVKLSTKSLTFKVDDYLLNDIIKKKEVVDIEKYRNNPDCLDEFEKFISIDSRIIAPLLYKDEAVGLVILGDKITIGDYSESEKEFLKSICEIFSIAREKVVNYDGVKKHNEDLQIEVDHSREIDLFEDEIRSSSLDNLEDIVSEKFKSSGIVSCALFYKNDLEGRYDLLFTDKEDRLNFMENSFSISLDNAYTAHLYRVNQYEIIENPVNSDILKKIFPQNKIILFESFISIPYIVNGNLIGFAIVFQLQDEFKLGFHLLYRYVKSIYSNYISKSSLNVFESQFVDDVVSINRRLENELKNAKKMNISLSFVLFSIKNYKRFVSLLGEEKTNHLIKEFKEYISSRFSETEFAVRYSRNKFLIVLPGKSKKYAVSFANSVRTNIVKQFSENNIQLMITFLISEFPEDGECISDLIDLID